VEELDTQCISLQDFKLLTTSFDGMVQVLVETIEEVRNLVSATVASAAEAYELLRPLGGLASDLTGVVRSISARMHLVGLNVQVQAAWAVDQRNGSGLEVLSARTTEISREANCISEAAATQLDELAAGLADTVGAFGQLKTAGLAQQAALNVQGRQEEENLHSFRDTALQTLLGIGNSIENVRTQTSRTLKTIKFQSFYQISLPALRMPLETMADTAQAWLQAQGWGAAQANLIQDFKKTYTMASEREVFEQIAARHGGKIEPEVIAVNPCPAPEFSSTVDLFLADDSTPSSPGETKPEDASLVAVGLADNPVELGANIELF
jgi:hypothetical protein